MADWILRGGTVIDGTGAPRRRPDVDQVLLGAVARGVFVGRERELGRLRGAFDEAFAGHGSVVMIENSVHQLEKSSGKQRIVESIRVASHEVARPILFGVAIIIAVYRTRETLNVDQVDLLKL